MIPQIQIANTPSNQVEQLEIVQLPSKTYRDNGKAIIGKITGIEAVTQTVRHILNKERYAYAIYSDNFGVELEKYQKQSFEYLQAQIQKDLTSALTQDDRINSIVVTNINKIDVDAAEVKFNVYSTEGVIEERIIINV